MKRTDETLRLDKHVAGLNAVVPGAVSRSAMQITPRFTDTRISDSISSSGVEAMTKKKV